MAEFYDDPNFRRFQGADGNMYRTYVPGLQNPEIVGPPAPPPEELFINRNPQIGNHPVYGPMARGAAGPEAQANVLAGAGYKAPVAPESISPMAAPLQQEPDMGPQIASANESLLSVKPSKPVQSLYDQGISEQKSGIMKQATAEAKQQNELVKIYDDTQKRMDMLAAEEAAKRQQWQTTLNDRISAIDAADKAARDAKVDGWANVSTGPKILATIGVILGGIGAGIKGGENQALNIINSAIDRDIQLQKFNQQQKKEYATALTQTYNMLRQQGADDVQATLAMKSAALERAKLMVDRAAAASGSDIAKSKAQQLIGALTAQQGQYRDQLALTAMDQFQKTYKPGMVIPGLGVATAGTEADVSKYRETFADMTGAKEGLSELLAINERGGKSLTPDLRARAQTLQDTLIGQMRVALTGPGAMSEGDRKLLERAIANPTDFLSLDSSNRIRLQTLIGVIDRKLKKGAQMLGLEYRPTSVSTVKGAGAFEKVQ